MPSTVLGPAICESELDKHPDFLKLPVQVVGGKTINK